MSFFLQKLNNTGRAHHPCFSVLKRYFSPDNHPQIDGTYKGKIPKRIGFSPHHHTSGLLPRLRIREKRLSSMPITSSIDEWASKRATEGQNDFIRIFGDESIQNYEMLTHIPDWLRGYRAKNEYSVLMRKRKEFEYWKFSSPLRWQHLEQRIKFLYRRINNKYKPPEVERLAHPKYVK